MTIDALTFGPSGGLRFSRNSGRSLTSEALGAIRYPSPFFDVAHTYLPSSFKTMLRWCRYYYLTNPLINAVCTKMAEYPITDLVFDTENEPLQRQWEYCFGTVLNFKKFEVEAGLDYQTYGNAFISISFPFHKLLICKHCGHRARIEKQKYVFREYKFVGECQRCGKHQDFQVRDHYIRSIRDVRLIRWNPEYITVQHNEATGESRYYYSIPPMLANDVRMAKRHIIERTPQIFMEALRQNKALLFSRDNIYHMKRPTIAQKDKGWGMPMILPVLKDAFYLQILKKAQESISIEHIVPLRLLFPQTSSPDASVYSSVNLTMWRDKVEQEIVRWRLDNNYIPLLPIPMGQQTLGGDGRALMLAQEYRVWSEHIIAGMGVPIEFVFGGMSFCNSLDSLVFSSKGLSKLRELVPSCQASDPNPGFSVATHLGEQQATIAHNTGRKKEACIRTRLGLEAFPSHDHCYLTLDKNMSMVWKKTKELQPGDFIAVQPGQQLWPVEVPSLGAAVKDADAALDAMTHPSGDRYPVRLPTKLTSELARLLGYLVSEGSCVSKTDIGFSQKDKEVLQDYFRCTEAVFGYRPGDRKAFKGCISVSIARRRAVAFLRSLGLSGYAADKTVPRVIREAPKHVVTEFLRAYFEGDGGTEDVVQKQEVQASSASKTLVKELQLLLLNLGIVSSQHPPTKSKPIWRLSIRSEYVDQYAREVGFISSRKKASLANRTATSATHVGERIPYLKDCLDNFRARHFDNRSCWTFEAINPVLDQKEYTVKQAAQLLSCDFTTVHYHIKKGRLAPTRKGPVVAGKFPSFFISKEELQRFLSVYGRGKRRSLPGRDAYGMTYSKLAGQDLSLIREKEPELAARIEALARTHYLWDEAVSVKLFDREMPMGDLTVEGAHSYIADGLVCHNSGSNVSLRILENHFLDQRTQHKQLVTDFIMPNIAAFMGWETIPIHYRRFKMADDLQRSALFLQVNQAGKLSDKSLLEDLDWDAHKESDLISVEQKRVLENQRSQALAQAGIQGEAQLVQVKYQTRAQKIMMEQQMPPMAPQDQKALQEGGMAAAGQAGVASPEAQGVAMNSQTGMMNRAGQIPPMELGGGEEQSPTAEGESPLVSNQPAKLDVFAVANQVVGWLNQLPEHEKQKELVQMSRSNPQLYSLVLQLLQQARGANQNSAGMPMPEQKPPMRGPEAIT